MAVLHRNAIEQLLLLAQASATGAASTMGHTCRLISELGALANSASSSV